MGNGVSMEKIRNLSLRKTIILYMVISLTISFFSAAIVRGAASTVQESIWWKYTDKETYFNAMNSSYEKYISYNRFNVMEISSVDRGLVEICDFIITWSVLLISIAGSCAAVLLFYKNKLKKPIEELEKASEFISQDVLDFKVGYENKDELGTLCKQFEKMRLQLVENNRTVWNMVEEEKILRAAIAHDIRSPLSVLKGYQEMLLEFVPEDTLSKDKMIEMLCEGMKQIERLNQFIEIMRKMSSLESRELRYHKVDLYDLSDEIEKNANILRKERGKSCIVKLNSANSPFYVDKEVIVEVVENLLSNALRYAKQEVEIVLSSEGNVIVIEVADDGNGFQESPETITKAFYHSNPENNNLKDDKSRDNSSNNNSKGNHSKDLQHFGIGMYISRIYSEKHGGKLVIGNRENGGAVVKAYFTSNL